jgi:hypothetical protein
MTPALMSPAVREELARLSRRSKAELRAWLNNKMQAISIVNENEAADSKLPHMVRAHARLRGRIMEEFQKDLDQILDLNPNSTLGATAEAPEEAHVKRA